MIFCLAGILPAAAQPGRVVSTFLCTDEYAFRLLPRARLAALSFLAGDTNPVVSTIQKEVTGIPLIRPDSETVLKLKPDLVLMYEGTNPRLRAHLARLGIRYLELPWANSIADVRRITRGLGKALGAEARAEAMLAEMDRDLAQGEARAHPLRTLIYEPNGYATSGGVTNEIMKAAGLENAALQFHASRTGAIAVEAVIAAAPDLLLLDGQSARSRGDLILSHPALKALPAKTAIRRISLTPLLCPGPWSARVVAPLAELARQNPTN